MEPGHEMGTLEGYLQKQYLNGGCSYFYQTKFKISICPIQPKAYMATLVTAGLRLPIKKVLLHSLGKEFSFHGGPLPPSQS